MSASPMMGIRGVYPRVCGGAIDAVDARADHGGLSPRVRGSHLAVRDEASVRGSIPACAGEP